MIEKGTSCQEVLEPKEVTAILEKAQNPTVRSAMCFIYLSGLRPQKTVTLMVKDVTEINGKKVIKFSKNKKDMECLFQLSEQASMLLKRWLYEKPKSRWLFPVGDSHVSVESLKLAFEIALVESGIKKKISLQALRSSFASACIQRNKRANKRFYDNFHHSSCRITDYYELNVRRD